MKAPLVSSPSSTHTADRASLVHPSFLHKEAQRLATLLEATLHDPAAAEEDFLQAVDRYAEVLHTLREATTTAEHALVNEVPDPTSPRNRPEVNLITGFALICAFILSVLYIM